MATIERVEARATEAPPSPAGWRRFGFGLVANTLLGYTLVKGLQLTLHNLIFPLYLYSLGYDPAAIGRINALGALTVFVVSIPLGALSDRIGRKRVIAGAAIAMAIAGIPCYALIVTGNFGLAVLGASLMAVIFAGHTAVIHILIVELFPTRVRYSAYGLGYNISAALFGGTAPLLMTLLIPHFGIYVPAYYAVLTALGTLAAVSTVKDRAHLPLRDTL